MPRATARLLLPHDNCTLCIAVMKWLSVFFHASTDRILPLKGGTCALKSAAGGARSCAVLRLLLDLGCRPCYLNTYTFCMTTFSLIVF